MKVIKKNNSPSRSRGPRKKDFFHKPIDWSWVIAPATQKWAIIFVLGVILSLIISSRIPSRTYTYAVGQVASLDIKAPQDFLVEDKPATLNKQQKALESVHSVYDFDPNLLTVVEIQMDNAFKAMAEYYQPGEKQEGPAEPVPAREPDKAAFEQLLGIQISDSVFRALREKKFDANTLRYVYRLLDPIFEQPVVSNRELLVPDRNRGIVIRSFPSGEETTLNDFSRIMDLDQARAKIKKEARLVIPSSERSLEKPVVEIAQGLLHPNLTFNKLETEERKAIARQAVKPVLFEVKKGEMIIREGEKVTPEHILKLNKLRELKTDQNSLVQLLSNFLFIFLVLSVLATFSTVISFQKVEQQIRELLLMSAMLIVITAMVRLGSASSPPDVLFLSDKALLFALPVATGALVISVVLGLKYATIFAVLVSIFSAMVIDYGIEYSIYPLIGSFIGAREAVHCNQRSTLLKAGLWVGLTNMLIILCLQIKFGSFANWRPLVGDLGVGFAGGILSGVIATGIVPLIEVVFSYTTDIKLLELGNLNNPLLRDLIVEAGGTYHHSIVTGSLAEAAAEAIGADPLLARVGAYYHDIGKRKKPLYFIENQRGNENKHDKLSPNMSSLILISHVKDGVEQARKYKLGKAITDIIQQHHGTSLISYFYQRAKEKENPAEAVVHEKDFRYPGPKPQTKEAALVMLADSVEAASRSLSDPTPARIQGMVRKTITNFFTDGQLDECELSLKGLNRIAKSFNRILTTGVFHHRIEYPERTLHEVAYQKNHETLDRESPKETKDRPKNGAKNREGDLKRLGIS